jgi:hypothetical protein
MALSLAKYWQSLAKPGKAWQSLAKPGKAWQSLCKFGQGLAEILEKPGRNPAKDPGKPWQILVDILAEILAKSGKILANRGKTWQNQGMPIKATFKRA